MWLNPTHVSLGKSCPVLWKELKRPNQYSVTSLETSEEFGKFLLILFKCCLNIQIPEAHEDALDLLKPICIQQFESQVTTGLYIKKLSRLA